MSINGVGVLVCWQYAILIFLWQSSVGHRLPQVELKWQEQFNELEAALLNITAQVLNRGQ